MNFSFTNIAYADGVDNFIHRVNEVILNPIIMLLFAVAFVYFFWGVSQMILNAESEEGRTTGKQHIMWGIIGMTIMFSVWGIMNLILNTIGVKGIDPKKGTVNLETYNPPLPTLGGSTIIKNPTTSGSNTLQGAGSTSTSNSSAGGLPVN